MRGRPGDPLDVQAIDPRPRPSSEFIRGFLLGLHRRDRGRRRERRFWLAVLLVVVAYAFFAGRASAAPRPAAQVTPSELSVGAIAETEPALRTEAPPTPVPSGATAPHSAPSGGIGEPASYCKPGYCETPKPTRKPIIPSSGGVSGTATWWYSFGPGLYAAIRPDLGSKGDTAIVCGGSPFHCLTLPIITTCACLGPNSDRLIDLSFDAFRSFADPSAGVVRITLQVLDR